MESLVGFPVIPKWVTLNDLELPFYIKFCFYARAELGRFWISKTVAYKVIKIVPYCQQHKCSVGTLVSGNIRFMQIFAWVLWNRGVK